MAHVRRPSLWLCVSLCLLVVLMFTSTVHAGGKSSSHHHEKEHDSKKGGDKKHKGLFGGLIKYKGLSKENNHGLMEVGNMGLGVSLSKLSNALGHAISGKTKHGEKKHSKKD